MLHLRLPTTDGAGPASTLARPIVVSSLTPTIQAAPERLSFADYRALGVPPVFAERRVVTQLMHVRMAESGSGSLGSSPKSRLPKMTSNYGFLGDPGLVHLAYLENDTQDCCSFVAESDDNRGVN